MCIPSPSMPDPIPAPAPPPVLEQIAPKSAVSGRSKRRAGLSRYKTPKVGATTNKLGGIPKKTGV